MVHFPPFSADMHARVEWGSATGLAAHLWGMHKPGRADVEGRNHGDLGGHVALRLLRFEQAVPIVLQAK